MNALFVDPAVEFAVFRAAKDIERAAQYGHSAASAVQTFDAARAEQAAVRRERGVLLRESGAIRW